MESVSLRHYISEDRTSGSSDADKSGDDMAADVIPPTWPPQAADLLLYTLTNDPSIRARRAAMKTLKAAQVRPLPAHNSHNSDKHIIDAGGNFLSEALQIHTDVLHS